MVQRIISSFLKAFGVVAVMFGFVMYGAFLFYALNPVVAFTIIAGTVIIALFIVFFKNWL